MIFGPLPTAGVLIAASAAVAWVSWWNSGYRWGYAVHLALMLSAAALGLAPMLVW